jgi:hypothetical protein
MKFGTAFRRLEGRMRLLMSFFTVLLLAGVPLHAQVLRPDSTRRAAPSDSVRIDAANVDSLETAPIPPVRMRYSPKQITRRSMILPGWGQLTMKQWYLLPVIYGGFGALGYAVHWNNVRLAKWERAYQILGPQVYPTQEMRDNGAVPNPNATTPVDGIERGFTIVQQARKQFLRQRDMCFIGMGLLYGLNVVQANVTAHLKTFDESDDISLRLTPGAASPLGVAPFGATLTLAFSSKTMRK